MRPLVWLAVLTVGFGGLLGGWVKYQENYGLFFPRDYSDARLKVAREIAEYRAIESEDGPTITALLRQGESGAPLVVMAHGNAGHMLDRVHWFGRVLPEDWSGMIFDYRGYGRSEGTPSVEGLKEDTRRAVEYGLETTGSDTLFLHGRSLGAPMVAQAAEDHPVDGLILESGFSSAREVVPHVMPIPGLKYLVGVNLDTTRSVRRAQEEHGVFPKLVIHGTADRILPIELGRALFEQVPEPKESLFVEGAGHNDLPLVAGDTYDQTIKNFLRKATEVAGATSGD